MSLIAAYRTAKVLADLTPDAPVISRTDMAVAAALAGVDAPHTAADRSAVCDALDDIEGVR